MQAFLSAFDADWRLAVLNPDGVGVRPKKVNALFELHHFLRVAMVEAWAVKVQVTEDLYDACFVHFFIVCQASLKVAFELLHGQLHVPEREQENR